MSAPGQLTIFEREERGRHLLRYLHAQDEYQRAFEAAAALAVEIFIIDLVLWWSKQEPRRTISTDSDGRT